MPASEKPLPARFLADATRKQVYTFASSLEGSVIVSGKPATLRPRPGRVPTRTFFETKGFPSMKISQGFVGGFGDADAGCGADHWGARRVLAEFFSDLFADPFSDPEAAGGGREIASVVASAGDGEGFGQASGAAGEFEQVFIVGLFGLIDLEASGFGHFFQAGERFEGAEEDAAGDAVGFAGDVEAVVSSVDEVDIGVAGRAEENGVAEGASGGGVGGGVVFAEVGFDFDDAGGAAAAARAFIANQNLAQEFTSYAAGIAREESPIERADLGGVRGLHFVHVRKS